MGALRINTAKFHVQVRLIAMTFGLAVARIQYAKKREAVYVGIRGTVLALDSSNGTEMWRSDLKQGDFVNVVVTPSAPFGSVMTNVAKKSRDDEAAATS